MSLIPNLQPHLNNWQTPPHTLSPLKLGTIHLWRADLDKQPYTTALLSIEEKARAAQFKFPIHQQRFTAARSILRCILARYLHQPPQTLQFGYAAHGKPYISTHPSIYFNLSHTNQWALYAISLEEKIGVDIEHMREDTEINAIASRFFSAYENQIFKQLPKEQKQLAFFKLWTCKEAFIKAIGEGLSFPLKDFDIDVTENVPRLITICGDTEAAQQWSFMQITALPEHYIGALATRSAIDALKMWEFAE